MIKAGIHMGARINFKLVILLAAVFFNFCFPMTVFAEEEWNVTDLEQQAEVTSDVNVRKGPSTDYEKIGTVRQGDVLNVTGKTADDWYRIVYQDTEGFVYGQYIRILESAPEGEDVGEQQEEPALQERSEPQEQESNGLTFGMIKILAVIVIIAVIIMMIILTLKSLRQTEDDDRNEDDEDDEDDEYDEDEEDDGDDEDDGDYEGDEEDDEDDENDEDVDEEDHRNDDHRTIVIREEDYQLHIDPKYFEDEPIAQPDCVTDYLLKKQGEEAEKTESSGNTGDLQKAMDKLQELQEEIERLKKKQ